ncbi:MAG: hypothetical protein ACFFD4_40930, partial [Candidatus Odinarchaeota archaeon]
MKENYFWLAVSSFTERGMVPKAVEENLPPLLNELHVLVNTYAFIVNSTSNGTLVGPIPLPNNPELRVFIYPFETIDYGVKDLR